MATNLAINFNLLTEAQKIGGCKTKKDTVNLALSEFVARRKQFKIKDLFGKLDWDGSYDYKTGRSRT